MFVLPALCELMPDAVVFMVGDQFVDIPDDGEMFFFFRNQAQEELAGRRILFLPGDFIVNLMLSSSIIMAWR